MPDGVRWKAVVYAGRDVRGRQRQRTVTGYAKNARDAAKAKEAARVRLRAELDQVTNAKETVAGLCDDWMDDRKREHAISTRYANGVMVRRVKLEIGRIRLDKLSARDLNQFYGRLLDGDKDHGPLSSSSVMHYHRLMHAMLRYAHIHGLVSGNVSDIASPPKVQRNVKAHTTPTPAALVALIASAPHSLAVAAGVAAATGCRRGEIVGLRWSDIRGTQLVVRESLVKVPGSPMARKAPKSGHERTMTLDTVTLQLLAAHRAWLAGIAEQQGVQLVDDGPVFAKMRDDPTGRLPYPPGWITQEWRKLCKRSNVQFRFHDLRHFHATELIDRKIPLPIVSQRLGHTKISTTTDIYTHALKASDDEAADAIGAALYPVNKVYE